jgi:hypothetical protein
MMIEESSKIVFGNRMIDFNEIQVLLSLLSLIFNKFKVMIVFNVFTRYFKKSEENKIAKSQALPAHWSGESGGEAAAWACRKDNDSAKRSLHIVAGQQWYMSVPPA